MENGASATSDLSGKISDKDRIAKAKEYKDLGNEFHKEGDLRQAIGKYHRALLQLKGIGTSKEDILFGVGSGNGRTNLSDEMKSDIKQIQMNCYNNLAATLLKQDSPNYEKIVEYCDQVLDNESSNEKALYRKGTALNKVGKFDDTIRSLEHYAKYYSLLRKPLATAREGQRLQGEKLKKNLQGMFDR